MNKNLTLLSKNTNRRSFLKNGTVAVSAATVGASLLGKGLPALANEDSLTRGDAAILRFLQALETIEADLWKQYAELGGATNQGISPIDLKDQNGNPVVTGLAPLYVAGLVLPDGDMPQYIVDNTDDEFSHASFLRNYLQSKGEPVVDLNKHFATLPPEQGHGGSANRPTHQSHPAHRGHQLVDPLSQRQRKSRPRPELQVRQRHPDPCGPQAYGHPEE